MSDAVLTEQQQKVFGQLSMSRLESVDEVTQTRHGSVNPIPVLHIPGAGGELIPSEPELDDDDSSIEEGKVDTSPESMAKLRCRVSGTSLDVCS